MVGVGVCLGGEVGWVDVVDYVVWWVGVGGYGCDWCCFDLGV